MTWALLAASSGTTPWQYLIPLVAVALSIVGILGAYRGSRGTAAVVQATRENEILKNSNEVLSEDLERRTAERDEARHERDAALAETNHAKSQLDQARSEFVATVRNLKGDSSS